MVPRPAALVAILFVASVPLAAQPVGSVNVAGSVVQYEGFLTSGAAMVAPSFRFDTPRLSLASQGSFTLFESGNGVAQGNLAAGWLAGSGERWRVEFSGAAGVAKYANEPSQGHVLGGARLHLFGKQVGGWIGASTGKSLGSLTATPVELSVAGWRARRRLAMVGSITATALEGDRYLDLTGALRWTGSGVAVEARLGARPWTRSRGEVGDAVAGAYGDLTAHVDLNRRLAVSVGGGSYPSDPARRVLAAKYLNLGVRVVAFGAVASADPLVSPGIAGRAAASRESAGARLEIGTAGDPDRRRFRVLASDVRTVDLMGDFTDWTAIPLVQISPGVWEATVAVPVGLHRLNIRLDGGPWVAPAGTRVERTEFGGSVGIVVVR